jgi:hypothetical protein
MVTAARRQNALAHWSCNKIILQDRTEKPILVRTSALTCMSSTHRHNNLTVFLFTHSTQKELHLSISLFAHNTHITSRTHSKHTLKHGKHAPTGTQLACPSLRHGKHAHHMGSRSSTHLGTTAGGTSWGKAGAHDVVIQLVAGEGQRRPLLVTASPLPPTDLRRRDLALHSAASPILHCLATLRLPTIWPSTAPSVAVSAAILHDSRRRCVPRDAR